MERNLFKYVWQHTRQDQIWILIIILASMPIYFLSLDLPKQIVNGPIQGQGFERPGATETFFKIELPMPGFISEEPVLVFSGFELDRLSMLVALSFTFLGLVCLNGIIKFYINTFKGRLGERMLRRLRYELIDRVLRFPNPHFRRVKAPELATMVKDEVEPLGGFIGDAFVQPVFLGGQALTAMAFILAQSFWLGIIAGGIVLVQAFVIPRLRRRLLELGRARQLTARQLAGRVGEIVDGISEVHTNDTSNFERADVSDRLGKIFFIRYEFYQRKFFIKFLNNFLAQITPFLFYLVGGYFALRGSLDIGQLVAVIAAYKDLPSPIKELIDWDQLRLDVQIKYGQVVEQFAPQNMLDPRLQESQSDHIRPISRPIEISNLSITDDTGAKLVEGVSFEIKPKERIAAVGEVNAGAEATGEAIARLHVPSGGRIRVDGVRLDEAPEALSGRRFAYLGPDTYLPNTTLYDALLYSLKHVPQVDAKRADHERDSRAIAIAEARASSNSTLDVHADWVDYRSAGVDDTDDLRQHVFSTLQLVELDADVFELGLRGRLVSERQGELAKQILIARSTLRNTFEAEELSHLVEPFDPSRYNTQATIAENLLFGTGDDPAFAPSRLAENKAILAILSDAGLDKALNDVGHSIAETVTELFADLPPDHPFFEQLTFMTAEEVPDYQSLLQRVAGLDFDEVGPELRAPLLRLSLSYIEPRHRLGLLDEALEKRIVGVRRTIRENIESTHSGAVAFYDPEALNLAASLEDNILFGRVAYGIADGGRRVRDAVGKVLDELDMRYVVYEAGLAFEVGTGGRRLTTAQRQKVGLARALLKRPDLLISNRGLSALGGQDQTKILNRVLELAMGDTNSPGFSIYWVLANPQLAKQFDRVIVFHEGRIAEDGPPNSLLDKQGRLAALVS